MKLKHTKIFSMLFIAFSGATVSLSYATEKGVQVGNNIAVVQTQAGALQGVAHKILNFFNMLQFLEKFESL